MKTIEDIEGFEYDWLACDEVGQVALFSTAGAGYAPMAFRDDTELYDYAIDQILKLGVFSLVKVFPIVGDGCENIWQKVSERGFYGYDADFNGGEYSLVSIPNRPITIFELADEIANVIKRCQFTNRSFSANSYFTKDDVEKLE